MPAKKIHFQSCFVMKIMGAAFKAMRFFRQCFNYLDKQQFYRWRKVSLLLKFISLSWRCFKTIFLSKEFYSINPHPRYTILSSAFKVVDKLSENLDRVSCKYWFLRSCRPVHYVTCKRKDADIEDWKFVKFLY